MKKFYYLTTIAFLLFGLSNQLKSQCNAAFNYTVGANGNVTFSSTSTGTNSLTMYSWFFGDGGQTVGFAPSTVNHTYANNGAFTATLTIQDSLFLCYSSVAVTLTVTTAPCTGSISINSSPAAGGIYYFSTPTGPSVDPNTTYNWNYGDGNFINGTGLSSVSHTYSASGNYTVTLSITDPFSICTYTTTSVISVTVAPCPLNPNFVYTVSGLSTINYTSTTTGTTSTTNYFWNFGDGGFSSLMNPSHTYTANGTYTVSLLVSDSVSFFCQSTYTATVLINSIPCVAVSNFTVSKDSSAAFTWNAYANYNPNTISAMWNWGDGNSTFGLYPAHTYSAAGFYNICLTVTVNCLSGPLTSSTCVNTNIFKMSANSALIYLNVKPASLLSVHEIQNTTDQLIISPNPSQGPILLQTNTPSSTSVVYIYNLLGELIYQKETEIMNGEVRLDLSSENLQNGTYFIKLKDQSVIQKLILIK